MDEKINPDLLTAKQPENFQGYFDTVTKFSSTTARVNGWVNQVKSPKLKVQSKENVQIKCIAILNQENVVKGFGMSGFPRADVAELLGGEYELSGWKGYIQASKNDVLTAYVKLKNSQDWIALTNQHSFEN
ncbi:hypothetical protein [Okeania sp. KiyG1]|uniref:hypothetical protein n=1 Tax=Okeania sp. KiyG1 TaxID=2720165 RepID=UPI0019C4FCA2|nr:hypothetical protein [Okeania sp. KiyG1]GGA22804.1 hypothetical protein CYANOKiyG1_38010 [Okeania sp. KiyG1]